MINMPIKFLILLLCFFLLQSCNAIKPKKVDTRETPINAAERARKNINEGKGASLGGLLGRTGKTSYEFSTSNPMWRASLEILDFVPLATVDYGGGVIITDWYSDDLNSNETIKIIVNFLSNEIRADGLKIKVYKKKCNQNQICQTQLLSTTIDNEIKLDIQHYKASSGTEYFISFETTKYLIGFLRLRLNDNNQLEQLEILKDCALIRELHVYSNLNNVGNHILNSYQHKGFGTKLIETAEQIAINNGYKKMAIISGTGVRNYYRKFGYELQETFMIKKMIP